VTVDAAQAIIALAALFFTITSTTVGATKWMLVRVEERMDRRFVESESRWDARFARSERRLDERFAQVDQRFEKIDQRFAQVDQELKAVAGALTEVKVAVARLEGPHPPFLIARG